ncbi:MAG: nucleotidyltransferase family protein [Fibrobacter sp.]|nr:nucleotidyltransferase family protein [Fibrobacter sp.]
MSFVPFQFLRYSLGVSDAPLPALSEREWGALHKWAERQSLLGVLYFGLQKLPPALCPPQKLAWRWSMEAEHIRGQNKKINETTAELTQLFEKQGHKVFVLKGSANALLYPDSNLRQTGDIDFFVLGGRSVAEDLLARSGLDKKAVFNSYHAEFEYAGEVVEVHYVASRMYAPAQNRALQKFLAEEAETSRWVPQGFYVPNVCYALVMQLCHLKQHFFKGGIGLRQLVDYHQLLLHCSADDRAKVAAQLKSCGLGKMAGAVMFALGEVFALEEPRMLCAPDKARGRILLKVVLEGGNFGWYAEDYKQPVIARWFKDRVRFLRLLPFDARESFWKEAKYWMKTVSLIPKRIKRRRLALGHR